MITTNKRKTEIVYNPFKQKPTKERYYDIEEYTKPISKHSLTVEKVCIRVKKTHKIKSSTHKYRKTRKTKSTSCEVYRTKVGQSTTAQN